MLRGDINGMIFDLDGTLVDTAPDIAAALNTALREVGQVTLPLAEVTMMIGGGIPSLVARAIERVACGSLQDTLAERMFYHYDSGFCINSQLMVGVSDCLFALRRHGFLLAVCTNKDQIIAEKNYSVRWRLGIISQRWLDKRPNMPKNLIQRCLTFGS